MPQEHIKDPDDIVSYQINWATYLGDDTIATSYWIVPDGITEVSATNTTTVATIKLSGGTYGAKYPVTNRIETAAGDQYDVTIYIVIWEK